MAIDKVVDSTQLNSDLTSVANAIRTKGGTSAQLAFPNEFISAIEAIPTGGGGSGLVYETGTWQPATDIARGTITFANTHTEAPVFVMLSDQTGTVDTTTSSNYNFIFSDYYKLWGHGTSYSSSEYRYANVQYVYRAGSTSSITASSMMLSQNSDSTTDNITAYPRYWVSPTNFYPYANNTSRYWRAGRTYKWIAVWKPTS